jgi:hypothetical protein
MPFDRDFFLTFGSIDKALAVNRGMAVAPAVLTWVRAIERNSRAHLLTAVENWEQRHTDLLVEELTLRAEGATKLGMESVKRLPKERALIACTLLLRGKDPYFTALSVGLSLLEGGS